MEMRPNAVQFTSNSLSALLKTLIPRSQLLLLLLIGLLLLATMMRAGVVT